MTRRTGVAIVLILVAPPCAHAQPRPSLEVSAGATLPIGDLGRSYDPGVHARAAVRLSMGGLPFDLRSEGELHRLDERFAPGSSLLWAAHLSGIADVVSVGAGGRVHALLGGGYASLDTSVGGPDGDLAVQGGLGVSGRLRGVTALLEARLVHVLSSPRAYRVVPVGIGVRF